jgi:hypothetical protein
LNKQGPFGSPSEVQPLSGVVGVGVGVVLFDLVLMEVVPGSAERRPARFARRFSKVLGSKPQASSEEEVNTA